MNITAAHLVLFFLVFTRVTSMLVVAPMFSYQAIPVAVKVAAGAFIALVLTPVLAARTAPVDPALPVLVIAALKEAATGLLIGFAASLLFAGIRSAGEIIAFDIGFSAANVFDPENGTQNPVLGEALYLFTMLIFLCINGHHFLLDAVRLSYETVPPGGAFAGVPAARGLVSLGGMVFVVAVKFAAPVMVSLFLTNVALAILSRVMPQMNIFTVSFPLKIGAGLAAIMVSIPLTAVVFKKSLEGFETGIVDLLKVLQHG
jgi:flagellar biosynthesis protein FliR